MLLKFAQLGGFLTVWAVPRAGLKKRANPVVPRWWSTGDGHTIFVSTNIEGIAAMSAIAATDKLFFDRADAALDQAVAAQIVEQALSGSDDGELFLDTGKAS